MRILHDTHVFLRALADDARLTAHARATIEEAQASFVSAASIWEIAIKAALGKLKADAAACARAIGKSGFVEPPVSAAQAARVGALPLLHGHKDPFDRILVAQSLVEPLVLLTADAKVAGGHALHRARLVEQPVRRRGRRRRCDHRGRRRMRRPPRHRADRRDHAGHARALARLWRLSGSRTR